MRLALTLAQRAVGRVAPNPPVGCVLVRDGAVVGRGWTSPWGRPHAEARALEQAGSAAVGATAYVTLEPCAHHGATPPCAEALADAGVARCVVAVRDPDPKASGAGIAVLQNAGVAVTEGVRADDAETVAASYLTHRRHGRPRVTFKVATSLDGRIATRTGASRWITGEAARRRVHLERARHDAVMVGSATAATDDPALTVRVPGMGDRRPVRIVVDSQVRVPLTHRLFHDVSTHPTIVLTRGDADPARIAAVNETGASVIPLAADADGRVALRAGMTALADHGITSVMVEGGGGLAASLFNADLIDRVAWFRGGLVLGGDGVPAVAGWGVETLTQAPGFRCRGHTALDGDTLEIWDRGACSRA